MPDQYTFDIDLITMVYGGDAMGRLPDGRAVFVPYGLPGERVRVRLTEQKKSFARAKLLEVLQPSPERITPACASYAACGGCHYMHMAYETQLRYKTAILTDQLTRIAGIQNPPVAPIRPSPQEWHYRNTVQFHLTPSGKLGFQEPGSHSVVPIEECPLCVPAIDEVWPLLDFADENGQAVPGLERIQLRAGAEDDMLLVMESNDPVPPEFTIDLPINAVFVGPGGFEENAPLVLSGDQYIVMEALGRSFRVSAGSFFQVNIGQAENMVRYLLGQLPADNNPFLLEVYAGVGLFSAFLAPKTDRVIAIESAPSAVEDFAVNLDEFDHVELYDAPAEFTGDISLLTTVCSRAETDSRRCEFAGARVSQRGRRPVFCGPREGSKNLGRRWQGIHRLRGKLGTVDPRSRSGRCCDRSARGGNARLKFWNSESAGSGDGGIDLRMDALDRKSADGEQRHGSNHVVHSSRTRFHRARQDHQVRRMLSRPC